MADPIRAALERLQEYAVAHPEHDTGELVAAALAALAAEPPAPAEPDTDAVLALAAIIRRVNGWHSLGAAALAEAILSHPGVAFSVLPPAPAEPVATLHVSDFRGYENYDFQHLVDLPPGHYKLFTACTAQPPAPAPAAEPPQGGEVGQ